MQKIFNRRSRDNGVHDKTLVDDWDLPADPVRDAVTEANVALSDIDFLNTVGTGTFGRVHLCRLKNRTEDFFFVVKVMKKDDIVRLKQVEHVNLERLILSGVRHPFVVNMFRTFVSERQLFVAMEYAPGGELFSFLRSSGRFSVDTARFYAAQVVLVFEYLHARDIVYRDLKPENILIGRDGYLKVTDFGFAKIVHHRTWTLCGTPEYLSPEVIQSKGHSKGVDWWALGVLIYEMLTGLPPFFDRSPVQIYEKILRGRIHFSGEFDAQSRDLICHLLTHDRTHRLGCLKGGAKDVKKHEWFRKVDWRALYDRKLRAPMVPNVPSAGDTSNFEEYREVPVDLEPLRPDNPYIRLFSGFDS